MNALLLKIFSQLLGVKAGTADLAAFRSLRKGDVSGFFSALDPDTQAAVLAFFASKIAPKP